MKKKIIGIFVCTLIISTVFPAASNISTNRTFHLSTRGDILYVGGSGPNNYTKIQEAVNDSEDGDTVIIYNDSSPYFEHVYVDKSIIIIGEDTNTTIIDAGGGEYAMIADSANGLIIRNLTLQNVTTIYGTNFAFFAQHSDDMFITNCCIRNSINGIKLQYSNDITMRNNRIENNTMNFGLTGWSDASEFYNDIDTSNTINGKPMYNLVDESNIILDGIDIGWLGLINCTNMQVKNIEISDCDQNILLIDTKDSIISNCKIYNAGGWGIKIGFDSDNNIIKNCPILEGVGFITNNNYAPNNNTVSNCNLTFGIAFQQSDNNCITNCNIDLTLEKSGVASWIAIGDSEYNTISNCKIYRNETRKDKNRLMETQNGIEIQQHATWSCGSNYNYIINNTFYNFKHSGISFFYNATYNNIIGNHFDNCNYDETGAGIYLHAFDENDNNIFYNNTFSNNSRNAYDNGNNCWNNSYPSGGNYWDDYTGEDWYKGPNQDILGYDRIGDTPYEILGTGNNEDKYPLMYPWGENPPIADFSFIANNYSVIFDASSSFDRDGNIISYRWDFDDGTIGTGMIINHTYSEMGVYRVSLVVTDDDGDEGYLAKYIRVPNSAPNIPSDPEPSNNSTNVDINTNISWNCSDPDGNPLTFNIFFEADDPTPDILVSENQTEKTYDPGKMNYSTTYYWQIIGWDNQGLFTVGPVWSFTTEINVPPNTPSDPEPPDGATDIDVNANLSWTGGDPDNDTVTYDVYFGDSSPPSKIMSNQSGSSYNPGTLQFNKKYYWKIITWDYLGLSASGPIWNFTTTSEPNDPPYPPSNPSPEDGTTDININADLSWTGGDPDEGDTVVYDVYLEANDPTPDNQVANDITETTFNPGTLDHNTTYYWQIIALDNHYAITEGPIWYFTTETLLPNLECSGSLDWTDVKLGETVTDSFTIENIGEPESLLDWVVSDYPTWGVWKFAPSSGVGLTPDDGEIAINVTVIAPDEKNTEFTGEVKIENLDNSSDYCKIDVSLSTPKNQNTYLEWLERFPLLQRLLGVLGRI